MANSPVYPTPHLPWSPPTYEDRRFRTILLCALLFFVFFGAMIPLLPLPEVPKEEEEVEPVELVKVIVEPKKIPPPPKPKPKIKEKPKPVKKKPKPQKKVKPKPKPKPIQTMEKARANAAVSGLLQFKDDLEEMRESVDRSKLSSNRLSRSAGEATKTERSLITNQVARTSEGISTSNLSRTTAGAALSGRETTQVSSAFSSQGGGSGTAKDGTGSHGPQGRTDESVRKVFDRNKGAIFAIYNRALRKDPTLEGKVLLQLVIEPSGAVSSIKVLSSELSDKKLVAKLVSRIRIINFGEEDVVTTTVRYPIEFLPL